MSAIAQIKSKREQIFNIASQHGINNVKIFGSALRGEETPESDIDLLVDCKDKCSLFDLIGLKWIKSHQNVLITGPTGGRQDLYRLCTS